MGETRFQTTKCKDHSHCLFMSNEGIKCAYCDYGIEEMVSLEKDFEKVLNDYLTELQIK